MLEHREEITAHFTQIEWKQGHADNKDINAVDHLTKPALKHFNLEQAEKQFLDLLPIVRGMDEMSLLMTFPPQEHLPIAHPLLPTPG